MGLIHDTASKVPDDLNNLVALASYAICLFHQGLNRVTCSEGLSMPTVFKAGYINANLINNT